MRSQVVQIHPGLFHGIARISKGVQGRTCWQQHVTRLHTAQNMQPPHTKLLSSPGKVNPWITDLEEEILKNRATSKLQASPLHLTW